jgi:molecular chaperone GrpE
MTRHHRQDAKPRAADGAGEPPAEPAADLSAAEAAPPAPAEPAPAAPAEAETIERYKDRWLRAEAELQNFRRRSIREWDEARRIAEERVMLEIIGAIDDLDRALEAARSAHDQESWIEGVRLTAQRLREYLARQGVTTLEPLGEKFDPAFHEAMLEIDAPEGRAAGDVVQVVLKGYARGDRPLRPARVVVARAPAGREA